jgi:hypothetical protein
MSVSQAKKSIAKIAPANIISTKAQSPIGSSYSTTLDILRSHLSKAHDYARLIGEDYETAENRNDCNGLGHNWFGKRKQWTNGRPVTLRKHDASGTEKNAAD